MISFAYNLNNLHYEPFMSMRPEINGSLDPDQTDPGVFHSTWQKVGAE